VTFRFRTKLFVGSVVVAAVSLLCVALLLSSQVRARQRDAIARRLTDEARLIADLLSAAPDLTGPTLAAEADRLGRYISGRVTLIREDGTVVADSTQPLDGLGALDSHASRPEILAARESGFGESQRYSATLRTDLLYVAVRAKHPVVRYVRLALPLTAIDAQLATIRSSTLAALGAAIPIALALAWVLSAPLAHRVQAIARVASRYSSGDLSRPAYDYGGDELGAVARALDASIQELGRRLDELSRDRARIDAILTGMMEGVLVVDGQGRLQLVNHAAQQMLHVDESAIGRPYVELIRHPDIAAQLGGALRGEEVGSCELSLVREPGRTLISRVAAVASAGGGGAVLVLHDVSDLRRMDQMRRDFVANVSHELRTPLTAIRGYVEALIDDPDDAANTRRFLDIIKSQSGRMDRLVTDLLRLARLDARQETLERTRCDLRQLITDVIADLAPAIEAKRQQMAIGVPEDLGYISVDSAKLHDILRNLVENAIHYSPPGAPVHVDVARDARAYTITVADSGSGIPEEDLTRIFERFYRVDKSRSRPGGTGLGLAIVKHLVELHGGTVTAANRAEGGAVVSVMLPVGPADVTPI
jgi:two-component system phosphate regulon sensor histidine kinase PhoR